MTGVGDTWKKEEFGALDDNDAPWRASSPIRHAGCNRYQGRGEPISADRFDTETNFLPTGERRCDHRYKAMDAPESQGGTLEWARCTNPATLRIKVTPASTVMPLGLAEVTYTPLPDEAYEAHSCADCYEAANRDGGTDGNPAKVELVADSRKARAELDKQTKTSEPPWGKQS